ncbi:MAG: hypothetical protein WC700_04230 [Gemmatimonadaceae bacterium]|jgi:hypothetical protein
MTSPWQDLAHRDVLARILEFAPEYVPALRAVCRTWRKIVGASPPCSLETLGRRGHKGLLSWVADLRWRPSGWHSDAFARAVVLAQSRRLFRFVTRCRKNNPMVVVEAAAEVGSMEFLIRGIDLAQTKGMTEQEICQGVVVGAARGNQIDLITKFMSNSIDMDLVFAAAAEAKHDDLVLSFCTDAALALEGAIMHGRERLAVELLKRFPKNCYLLLDLGKLAITKNCIEVLEQVLQKIQTYELDRLLEAAMWMNNIAAAVCCIEYGATIGPSVVQFAVSNSSIEMFRMLENSGFVLDFNWLLALAVTHRRVEIAQFSIDRGATNLREAVLAASSIGLLPIVDLCVRAGADVDFAETTDVIMRARDWRPAHYTAWWSLLPRRRAGGLCLALAELALRLSRVPVEPSPEVSPDEAGIKQPKKRKHHVTRFRSLSRQRRRYVASRYGWYCLMPVPYQKIAKPPCDAPRPKRGRRRSTRNHR